jgi:hypothetical protein
LTTLPDLAETRDWVREILQGSASHSRVVSELKYHDVHTTESSVRRWRVRNLWEKPEKAVEEAPTKTLHTEPEQGSPEAVADEGTEAIIKDLRRKNLRLLKRLNEKTDSKAELVQAVIEAATDAASALDIPKVPQIYVPLLSKSTEIAVPLLSDVQLAKITTSRLGLEYSSEIAEKRVQEYALKIIQLTEIQRKAHTINRVRVPLLGDVIEGEGIFPGQQYLVDAGLYRQITVDGPRILVNFFRTLLTAFDEVEVDGIIGNHGRIGARSARSEHDPETNGDRMLYKIVEQIMVGEPRIKFNIPDGKGERNWYGILREGDYSALMIHGDQIRGHSGFPWYGLGKKVNGWASGAIREQFKDVFMGHWHQNAVIPLNDRDVYVNGSTESYNTYAQENLAAIGRPSQRLLFVSPDRGTVTAQYKVNLTEEFPNV